MRSPYTVKLVPLAPPAATPLISAKHNTASTENKFWPAWLSPKISRPSRLNRRHTTRDEHSPIHRRPRGTSLDETSSRDDPHLVISSHADRTFDTAPKKAEKNSQSSLLTAFLLSLNEILPEYCNHLMNASNLGPSNKAAEAIQVLERRGSEISSYPRSPSTENQQLNSQTWGSLTSNSTFSPSQFLKQLSSSSPVKDTQQSKGYEHLQHLLSPHPNGRPRISSSESANTPRSAPSSPSHFPHGMSKTASNEWERFVSPFLLLAGAEVLYGRMEHLIDPNSESEFHAKTRPESKSNDADIIHIPIFQFPPFLDCLKGDMAGSLTESIKKSPIVSFASRSESPSRKRLGSSDSSSSASRRGSSRLIAIYQQARSDLVIVGEYLCDPVLGSIDVVEKKVNNDRIPQLPYQDDAGERISLKPTTSANKGPSLENCDREDNARHLAALSLRDMLSNLISFIDSRCTLINVHVGMCSASENMPYNRNWIELSEQCLIEIPSPLSTRVAKEAKALRLALQIANYIESFEKLFILLGSTPANDSNYLPIMWIRTSFSRILSMTRVMFTEIESLGGASVQPLLRRLSSNKKTLHQEDSTQTFSQMSDEFVSVNGDLPVAVLVARQSEDSPSWLPVYIKNSCDKNTNESETAWPLMLWPQVSKLIESHSKEVNFCQAYEIDSEDTNPKRTPSIIEIGMKHVTNNAGTISQCNIATISPKVRLVVIRGPDRKPKLSDDDILRFISDSSPMLLPESLFNVDGILRTKALINHQDMHRSKKTFLLWDGMQWSETESKQKQIKLLNTMGLLRNSRNHSPLITPLKSPYVKDLRRRRKKSRSVVKTMNSGHLNLFLGDLSRVV